MKTLFPLLIGVVLLATGLSSYGDIPTAVTPLGSSINLNADANAGASPAQNQNSVSQSTTLNPLSNSITVQAVNGNLAATVVSDGTASWTSASAGVFSIGDSFTSDPLSQYSSSRVAVDGSSWVYSFLSSTPATLTLNYSVAYTGPYPFGTILCMNQFVGDTAPPQGLAGLVKQAIIAEAPNAKPPTSGSAQFSLNAGTHYTFQLFDDSNLNDLPAFSSEMNANFSFQITPVPEPSSLALAGLAALMFLRCLFSVNAPGLSVASK